MGTDEDRLSAIGLSVFKTRKRFGRAARVPFLLLWTYGFDGTRNRGMNT